MTFMLSWSSSRCCSDLLCPDRVGLALPPDGCNVLAVVMFSSCDWEHAYMAAMYECKEVSCRQESYLTTLLRRGALLRTRRGTSFSKSCLVLSTATETW